MTNCEGGRPTVQPTAGARTVAVVGAGGWGTALAILAAGLGHRVRLWCRRPELAASLLAEGENRRYLPGIPIPGEVVVGSAIEGCLAGAEIVLLAVPVQHLRGVLCSAAAPPGDAILVGAAKGFERQTLLRVSEIVCDVWGTRPFAALSGPSFALEAAAGDPTAVTAASGDRGCGAGVQAVLSSPTFRVYTSDDVVGVEVAGALKNVMAIAAGMIRGLGHGANALGGLVSRGLAEMRRLGVALGGCEETFLGLAGVGDLVTTAAGPLSRNGRVGQALAEGKTVAAGYVEQGMVAEGVETARAAIQLAAKHGVEMPITRQVYEVLFDGKRAAAAVETLLRRPLRAE